ncbi:MAG: hypothetical protein LBN34_09800 [Clostridiales Family XIII bacterium]|jgi:hypothetical protein|nr:hypothetical protein [Clostridiales Family XIII bacterium]
MKQFIVLAAILPLMLFFLMQFPFEEARHTRLVGLEERIHIFKVEVANNPESSGELADGLKVDAAKIYGISASEVSVTLVEFDESQKCTYSVELPTGETPEAIKLIHGKPKQGRLIVSGEIIVESPA